MFKKYFNFINDYKNKKILKNFLNQKIEKTKENIIKIHCITFRKEFPNGGAGGGGAVLSCMKKIIGNKIENIKYTFEKPNEFSVMQKSQLADLWGAIKFALDTVKEEQNTCYITHDYGTAFGLYLMGKTYVYVAHLQGPRVEEKKNFGEKFSKTTEKIIKYCEHEVFKNAFYVCFPSYGAYEYYCSSKFKSINKNEFTLGPILYNTLYAEPDELKVDLLKREDDKITILSIGQLTRAKGMDLHPKFLENILKHNSQNIRYIFVGKGILKKKIYKSLKKLQNKYKNFEFIHIEKCSYPEIQYLQNISDAYLMLHRISIFDLATLEMMNKSKCIILSNIGGNPEFNKDNNIILIDFKNKYNNIKLSKSYIKNLGEKNKKVYDKYFSNEKYLENYKQVIQDMINSKINT